jgi:hypothetical protein
MPCPGHGQGNEAALKSRRQGNEGRTPQSGTELAYMKSATGVIDKFLSALICSCRTFIVSETSRSFVVTPITRHAMKAKTATTNHAARRIERSRSIVSTLKIGRNSLTFCF